MRIHRVRAALCVAVASIASARLHAGTLEPAEVRRLLADRVRALGGEANGIGIVVGEVGPAGTRFTASGRSGHAAAPLDADTAFEIASVTKVFTALLLEDMVERGEVALEDPVARYLAPGTALPPAATRPITLLDLVTHTSGLPFMSDDLPAFDDAAAGEYRSERLYHFLAQTRLRNEPGTTWDYSNLGYWLLGEALARRGGADFPSLLSRRVLVPLGLRHTGFLPAMRSGRLAVGHDAVLGPAPYFSMLPVYSLMPAAGGLVSTPRDLAHFLEIVLGRAPSPLAPALASMLRLERPKGRPGARQAIGWVVEGDGPKRLVFHDGGSFGFASALVVDPGAATGALALSNQLAAVSDLAVHLLRPETPLETPTATKRIAIPLSAKILDSYVGSYDGGEEGVFTVLHERDALTLRLPADWGLPPMRVWPETPREFFAAELPLRVSFELDAASGVVGMRVYPPRGQRSIETVRR